MRKHKHAHAHNISWNETDENPAENDKPLDRALGVHFVSKYRQMHMMHHDDAFRSI